MPLPPLPKAMGSILKEGEMTVKPASNPKSFKTAVKEKPVVSETNKAVKRVNSSKAADLLEKKENLPKKQKGYRAKTHGKKLFVLDTNVLMHDPISLFQFEEHDVFLPMITLEELDGHKKGMSDVARNARQVSRYLDQLLGHSDGNITEGIELSALGNTEAQGKLFFQTQTLEAQLPQGLPQGKADNQILGVVQALQNKEKEHSVVLVSKDINMRIKATAMGLAAEDYFSDKTLDDTDMLYSGRVQLPEKIGLQTFLSIYPMILSSLRSKRLRAKPPPFALCATTCKANTRFGGSPPETVNNVLRLTY